MHWVSSHGRSSGRVLLPGRKNRSDDDGDALGRSVGGESRVGSEWSDVVEGRSPEEEVESEAGKGKERIGVERTERTKQQRRPKAKRKKQQGAGRGGIGGKGFGAELCKGRNGEDYTKPGHPDAERLAGGRVGSAQIQVPVGRRRTDGYLEANNG